MKIPLGTRSPLDWKNLSPDLVIKIFSRRHKTALTLGILIIFLNIILPFIFIKIIGIEKDVYVSWGLPYTGILLPIGVLYIIFRYRCPRCNAPPTSTKVGAQGVLLFPKKCGNCGVALLPHHPWSTD
ncbi:hypothetical protein [Massilia sp. YIM B04103]|uniref:hypothetical protein n=1 Tax=Massilia sp. YIM B04103 TaxID=2963106 RepID=UPI00210DAC46|nr:hypothetical protein [Massilia sp. YIM B04103]